MSFLGRWPNPPLQRTPLRGHEIDRILAPDFGTTGISLYNGGAAERQLVGPQPITFGSSYVPAVCYTHSSINSRDDISPVVVIEVTSSMSTRMKKHLSVLVILGFFGVSLSFLVSKFQPRPSLVVGNICNLSTQSQPFIPIQNTGTEALQLEGWLVHDSEGTSTLPSLLLPPQGVARIWSGPQSAYPAIKPHYWLEGISGSGPIVDTVSYLDLYVGRTQTTWSWTESKHIALQAPYLFSEPISPKFIMFRCDLG